MRQEGKRQSSSYSSPSTHISPVFCLYFFICGIPGSNYLLLPDSSLIFINYLLGTPPHKPQPTSHWLLWVPSETVGSWLRNALKGISASECHISPNLLRKDALTSDSMSFAN